MPEFCRWHTGLPVGLWANRTSSDLDVYSHTTKAQLPTATGLRFFDVMQEQVLETHGPLADGVALWFAMLSPIIGLIVGLLAAWIIG